MGAGVGVETGAARKAATSVGLLEADAPGEALLDGTLVEEALVDTNCEPAARRYWANRFSAASN